MKKVLSFVVLLVTAALLAACGNDSFAPQSPQHPAPFDQGHHQAAPSQPQVAQQPQDSGISWGSVAAGAVGGYLLGKALSPSAPPPSQPQHVIVRETTRYVTRPTPAPSAAVPTPTKPSAPAFAAPATPSPAAPAAPKPTVVIPKFSPPPSAPSKFSGPSGYSSVTQSRPSYSSSSSSRPSSSSRR